MEVGGEEVELQSCSTVLVVGGGGRGQLTIDHFLKIICRSRRGGIARSGRGITMRL